ncbi:MAG: hypothetical protein ACPG4Z_06855, partial [Chitinophagales bacterium]
MAFLGGVLYSSLNTAKNQFFHAVEHANTAVKNVEQSFNSWTTDSDFLEATRSGDLGVEELAELEKLPYHLFIYQKDSLVLWNHNAILLDVSLAPIAEDGSFLSLKNGHYIAFKKEVEDYTFLAMLLVKNNFSIENQYLKNEFSTDFGFNKSTKVESANYEIGESIVSTDGKTLFKVIYQPFFDTQAHKFPLLVSYLTVLISLILFVIVVVEAKEKWGYLIGLMAL